MKIRFFVLMGVAGSGKTTIGTLLAKRLGWNFYDADGFHPAENVAKMSKGTPLGDEDRVPWLAALNKLISASLQANRPAVLACSALKDSYRQQLLEGTQGVQIVYLKGSYELIWSRLTLRKDHYMKPNMLRSQFEALEEPTGALVVDVSRPVEDIVQGILKHMESCGDNTRT